MLQEDVKRLLAYSGISHVGFLLMAAVSSQSLVLRELGARCPRTSPSRPSLSTSSPMPS